MEKLAQKVGGWRSEGFREPGLAVLVLMEETYVFLIPEGNGQREFDIAVREERADGEKFQVKRQGPDAKHRWS